ncbi:hypothetical protein V6N11_071192 [Hibiscus sabdariffa]|uniref:Uncharacterized protein n=1 Tax=Hibiscus sabdariffa TaxID=183260 RepID=A0ABR2TZG6_9ROSI
MGSQGMLAPMVMEHLGSEVLASSNYVVCSALHKVDVPIAADTKAINQNTTTIPVTIIPSGDVQLIEIERSSLRSIQVPRDCNLTQGLEFTQAVNVQLTSLKATSLNQNCGSALDELLL